MGKASLGLKVVQTFIYGLAFLCSAVILGIYSYFLATEKTHHAGILIKHRAIEGIGGSGVLYTLIALVLTCFLGGIALFAFLGVILDLLFTGGFIAVAIMTKDGATSCKGNNLKTPLGNGPSTSHIGRNGAIYTPMLRTVCHLESAVFAVSIIGAFLFLLAAVFQLWLGRRHQKDKRYGPSPANGYTSGSGGRGFFRRRRGARVGHDRALKDAEVGAIPAGGLAATNGHHHHHADTRDSYAGTATTGDSYVGNKYENNQHAHEPVAGQTAGGYHTGPAGTGVNPYGYDNTRSHGTAY